jgi:HK97 family phage prohead protease
MEINKTVIREAVVRALTDKMIENREAEFVISNETVDSYRTVFKMAGWDLNRYNQNPIVCYQHRSSSENPDMILGTSVVRIEDNNLIAVVRFEREDVNPLAEKVWRKIQSGTLRMASIGANINKGHYGDKKLGEDEDVVYFDSQELREWSIVALGSNPDAQKREMQTAEEIRAEIIKEIPAIVQQTKQRTNREAQLIINQNSY